MVCAAESAGIRIDVSSAGQFTVSGKSLDEGALERALAELASRAGDEQVLIVADEKAPLGAVTKIMDLCRKIGLKKFTLRSK